MLSLFKVSLCWSKKEISCALWKTFLCVVRTRFGNYFNDLDEEKRIDDGGILKCIKEFWFNLQEKKNKESEKMNMDSLLNASGQQLPNNHFVDSQVTEKSDIKLEFFVVVEITVKKSQFS